MLKVDEHQFEIQYAPIACGLMVSVMGCALASVVTAIWFFLLR